VLAVDAAAGRVTLGVRTTIPPPFVRHGHERSHPLMAPRSIVTVSLSPMTEVNTRRGHNIGDLRRGEHLRASGAFNWFTAMLYRTTRVQVYAPHLSAF